MKLYLLNVSGLAQGDAGNRFEELLALLDETRREKVLGAGTPRARAAELGAGLLLQKAALDREMEESEAFPGLCTVSGLCAELRGAFPLRYLYGEKGKPYFAEIPLFFSLSHSGDYVLCAVARREIGADLQKCTPVDACGLARRFFSEPERLALEHCKDGGERQKLFYELWTRKEAYGKLTGEGMAAALGRDMLPEEAAAGREESEEEPRKDGSGTQPVRWILFPPPPGYAAAVCVEGTGI